IVRGLESVRAVPGRFEVVSRAGEPQVIVDYAHTPDALTQALGAAREITTGRLLCVFGCGGDRDRTKRPMMGAAAAAAADWVLVTSDNPRSESPAAIAAAIEVGLTQAGACPVGSSAARGYAIELDRATAIRLAIAAAGSQDTVLIAGKGHEGYQIVGAQTLKFDDRVYARAVLDEVTR
ncbi:MAG: cyanophycin synthetase, partial [Myxococcota bacterium]